VNHHPIRRRTAPDGSRASIDVLLVPLIEALWAAGYETIGCCQDLGESLHGHDRKSAFPASQAGDLTGVIRANCGPITLR
jgi:hypothetical protein